MQSFKINLNWNLVEAQSALQSSDWELFNLKSDFPILRNLMLKLEKENGITDLHYWVSEKLFSFEKKLKHRFAHKSNMVGFSISPDGKHFATISWLQEGDWDGFGDMVVWETETGKLINTTSGEGGFGWMDNENLVKWSHNGKKIVAAHHTNAVAVFEPFTPNFDELCSEYVTDGMSRPPDFDFSGDDENIIVYCNAETQIGANKFKIGDSFVSGFYIDYDLDIDDWDERNEAIEAKLQEILQDEDFSFDGDAFEVGKTVWSKGNLLWTLIQGHLFCFDAITGEFKTAKKTSGFAYHLNANVGVIFDNAGYFIVFDLNTGDEIKRISSSLGNGRNVYLHNNDFSPNGKRFIGSNGYAIDIEQLKILGNYISPKLAEASYDDNDCKPTNWLQDSIHYALLRNDSFVEIWNMETSQKIKEFEVFEEAVGIFAGNNGIVAVCCSKLGFYDLEGNEISIFDMEMPDGESYPNNDDSELNEELHRNCDWNVAFMVKEDENWDWAAALPNGIVVCPKDFQHLLDQELAYLFDNQFAWFFRWTKSTIVDSLEDLLKIENHGLKLKNVKKGKEANEDIKPIDNKIFRTLYVVDFEDDELKAELLEKRPNLLKVQVATQIPAKYKADKILKGNDLTLENLEEYVGKVLVFESEYNKKNVSTLVLIDEGYCTFYDQDSSSYGISNYELENLKWVGIAIES